MIRAIIIDDEPLAISVTKEYLALHSDIEVIGECNDGFRALKMITDLKPDLIFLDVQMPKITGLEMLELIDEDELPAIIFTTAFEEYAIKAFENNAVDYLLKPYSQERFDQAMVRLRNQPRMKQDDVQELSATQTSNRIVLRDNGQIKIIAHKDIRFLEADDDYVKIHCADGVFMKKITLKHYENVLPSELFIRIHRSFMANVNYITRIEPCEKTSHIAILTSGEKLQVSKSGYQLLKEVLGI